MAEPTTVARGRSLNWWASRRPQGTSPSNSGARPLRSRQATNDLPGPAPDRPPHRAPHHPGDGLSERPERGRSVHGGPPRRRRALRRRFGRDSQLHRHSLHSRVGRRGAGDQRASPRRRQARRDGDPPQRGPGPRDGDGDPLGCCPVPPGSVSLSPGQRRRRGDRRRGAVPAGAGRGDDRDGDELLLPGVLERDQSLLALHEHPHRDAHHEHRAQLGVHLREPGSSRARRGGGRRRLRHLDMARHRALLRARDRLRGRGASSGPSQAARPSSASSGSPCPTVSSRSSSPSA